MPKNSVTPVEGDPYDEMRKKIRSNRPKRWPLVIGLFTLVGGILFAYLSGYTLTKRFSPAVWPSQVWWAVGEVGVEYAIAGAEFGLLVLVGTDALLDSVGHKPLLMSGREYLKKYKYDDPSALAVIDEVDNRAEAGIATAQVQIAAPVLLIPILYPVLTTHLNIDIRGWGAIAIPFLVITLLLFFIIDRANTDRAIRDAISGWRREQKQQSRAVVPQQPIAARQSMGGCLWLAMAFLAGIFARPFTRRR